LETCESYLDRQSERNAEDACDRRRAGSSRGEAVHQRWLGRAGVRDIADALLMRIKSLGTQVCDEDADEDEKWRLGDDLKEKCSSSSNTALPREAPHLAPRTSSTLLVIMSARSERASDKRTATNE